MKKLISTGSLKSLLETIKRLRDLAPEGPPIQCQNCQDKGLRYIYRFPDFNPKIPNDHGSYETNGPQWLTPYEFIGVLKYLKPPVPEPDPGTYSAVALCECAAGLKAKIKYPNLRVFHSEPQEEIPF